MFTYSDLKQTRVYQEAREEGELRGEQRGEQRGELRFPVRSNSIQRSFLKTPRTVA